MWNIGSFSVCVQSVHTLVRQYINTSIFPYVSTSVHSCVWPFRRSYIRISVCSGIHLNELPLCWPYESTSISLFNFIFIFPYGRPFSHKDGFPYILPYKWMTGCLTYRNCKHNDGHSEKDLPLSESADNCRPSACDFHPLWTLSHHTVLIFDNPMIYRNAYDCRMPRLTAIPKQCHLSSIPCLGRLDFL